MSKEIQVKSGGISFLGVLGIIFITLKLIGTITWSWGWVLLPIYGPALVALIVFLIILIGAGIIAVFSK